MSSAGAAIASDSLADVLVEGGLLLVGHDGLAFLGNDRLDLFGRCIGRNDGNLDGLAVRSDAFLVGKDGLLMGAASFVEHCSMISTFAQSQRAVQIGSRDAVGVDRAVAVEGIFPAAEEQVAVEGCFLVPGYALVKLGGSNRA